MKSSPRGRTIEYVDGDPETIISRGEKITELGEMMQTSAETLKSIKDRAIDSGGQKGKAIEKLRDTVGDSHEKLAEAGDLYAPVGPVITTYGNALDSVQPLIKAAVDDSEDLWATYQSLPGHAEGDNSFQGFDNLPQAPSGDDSPEAKAAAEAAAQDDAAKQAAYDAWEERAKDFDAHYDTWEDAFDTAVDNIGDEMAGTIKDGFWDNIGPVVDFLKNVLDIAALIVGIAALFFGGWVIALAAVLAFAVLALTAAQAMRGAATWQDLAWAAVGVLPFGKLTNFTKLRAFSKLGETGLGKVFRGDVLKKFTDLGKIMKAADPADGSRLYKLGITRTSDVLDSYGRTLGRTLTFSEQAAIGRIAQVEAVIRNGSSVLSHYGRLNSVTNHPWNPMPDLPKVPKPIGIVL